MWQEKDELNKDRGSFDISPAERRLVEYVRDLKWGTVEISVQNGKPVLIKAAVKTVRLT